MRAGALALLVTIGCGGKVAAPHAATKPADSPLADAVWAGDRGRVDALLAAHEDPAAIDGYDMAPWMWAMVARDTAVRDRLLAAAASLDVAAPSTAIAFRLAVSQGDVGFVRELIRRGVPVDSVSEGRASPLLIAAANGDRPMVELLLGARASVNAADLHGDTPLMAAVRGGARDCVELLLAGGARVTARDHDGRTALAWARRDGDAELATLLIAAGASASAEPTVAVPTAAEAIARSMPLIQRGTAEWIKRTECRSCHHQPMAVLAVAHAERAGIAFDRALARAQLDDLAAEERRYAADARAAMASELGVLHAGKANGGDLAFGTALFLSARLTAGLTPGGPEQASAAVLARLQLADGHWRFGPLRGSIESSDIATTTLAMRVIDALARGPDTTERLRRARRWLLDAAPVTVVDHAYRLIGLRGMQAGDQRIAEAVKGLVALQHPDGGWGHLATSRSDAYATGLALVALHEAGGVAATADVYRAGVAYLLATQEADGSWLVHSRAAPVLPYVDGGSPHGKFQFVSFTGTCWATIALIYAARPDAGIDAWTLGA